MRDFTKEQTGKELTFFLLPLVCSGVFQQVYALINTAVVSRCLTYEAVAVIGACSPFLLMQGYIFTGMTTGFSFYIFRCIGTGDRQIFRKGFWGAVFMTGVLAGLGMLLIPLSGLLMDVISVPETLRGDAGGYLFFLIVGAGILGLKNLLLCTIQGMGDSRFPGILSMAGVVSQTVLTVFFIAGLRCGVASSAFSILLNNMILSACMIFYLYRHCREWLFGRMREKIPAEIWMELLKSGINKSGMMILIGLGTLSMQKAVNRLSSEIIAANAYVGTINGVLVELYYAYAVAAGVIAGQNTGRKNVELIRFYNRKLIFRDFCWSAGFILLSLSAAPWLICLLAGSGAALEVIGAGSMGLRICCVGYPGVCLLMISRNVLQSMGDYTILPLLGFMEMMVNVVMSFLVPEYGYPVIFLAVCLKWWIPGTVAYMWYRRSLEKMLNSTCLSEK